MQAVADITADRAKVFTKLDSLLMSSQPFITERFKFPRSPCGTRIVNIGTHTYVWTKHLSACSDTAGWLMTSLENVK